VLKQFMELSRGDDNMLQLKELYTILMALMSNMVSVQSIMPRPILILVTHGNGFLRHSDPPTSMP
jgi:hypothetical protein